jgi:cation diffusion facilitator family transporter
MFISLTYQTQAADPIWLCSNCWVHWAETIIIISMALRLNYLKHFTHSHSHTHLHDDFSDPKVRSKEGTQAVALSLLVLFITSTLQAAVFLASHSLALFADLIHNFGDSLTAIPLGLAFVFKSRKAEKAAGYFVILTILVSACIVLQQTVQRFLNPQTPSHLLILCVGAFIGFLGNEIASIIRIRSGEHLKSPALIADGQHARIDGIVSLSVIFSALGVALGFQIADPIIGLIITLLILRITWQAWRSLSK